MQRIQGRPRGRQPGKGGATRRLVEGIVVERAGGGPGQGSCGVQADMRPGKGVRDGIRCGCS